MCGHQLIGGADVLPQWRWQSSDRSGGARQWSDLYTSTVTLKSIRCLNCIYRRPVFHCCCCYVSFIFTFIAENRLMMMVMMTLYCIDWIKVSWNSSAFSCGRTSVGGVSGITGRPSCLQHSVTDKVWRLRIMADQRAGMLKVCLVMLLILQLSTIAVLSSSNQVRCVYQSIYLLT